MSDQDQEQLVWTVWSAKQRPAATAAVIALILGVSWYAYADMGHIAYTVVALVVLTASLTSFLFPLAYTLDREGIQLRGFLHSRRRSWDELACFLQTDDFVAVSSTPEPTERSIRRGLILRLAGNGDEVSEFVSRHLPQWHTPTEGGEEDD